MSTELKLAQFSIFVFLFLTECYQHIQSHTVLVFICEKSYLKFLQV